VAAVKDEVQVAVTNCKTCKFMAANIAISETVNHVISACSALLVANYLGIKLNQYNVINVFDERQFLYYAHCDSGIELIPVWDMHMKANNIASQSPWIRILIGKLILDPLAKKSPEFCGNQFHYRFYKNMPVECILNQMIPVHIYLILSSHLHLVLPSSLFLSVPSTKLCVCF